MKVKQTSRCVWLLKKKQEQPLPRESHLFYIIRHLFQGLEWRFIGLHHVKHHADSLGKGNIPLGFWVLHLCPGLLPSWRIFVILWFKPEAGQRGQDVPHRTSPLSKHGWKQNSAETRTQQILCRDRKTLGSRTSSKFSGRCPRNLACGGGRG